jgi:hypothetical protein
MLTVLYVPVDGKLSEFKNRDPCSQIGADYLRICMTRFVHFCTWIRIRIQQLKLMRIHAHPDPQP